MAGGATGQHIRPIRQVWLLNVIDVVRQILCLGYLFVSRVLCPPFHVENFFLRSHEFFRIAVATKTPFHLQ